MDVSGGTSPSPPSPPPPPQFRNRYWILRHGRSVPNDRGLIVSSPENGAKPEFGLAPEGVEQARTAGESLRKELEELRVLVDSVKIRYSPFSRTTETARAVAAVLGVPFEGPSCEVMNVWIEKFNHDAKNVCTNSSPHIKKYAFTQHMMEQLIVNPKAFNIKECMPELKTQSKTCNILKSDLARVELRERYFGPSYELLSHEKYADVWAMDKVDPFMAPDGGESVADVASRLTTMLSSMDMEFDGSAILIVSHGDPLQIFQSVLSGAKENSHFLDEVTDLKKKSTIASSVLSQHRKFALNTGELRRVV